MWSLLYCHTKEVDILQVPIMMVNIWNNAYKYRNMQTVYPL